MIGMRVLIGITRVSAAETTQEQMYGVVISAHERNGFQLRLEGKRDGEIFTLPPHIDAFHKAKPGAYHLRSTSEVVIDPDYTTT